MGSDFFAFRAESDLTNCRIQSPFTSSSLSPDAFKPNIHRNKSRRWVEAPKVDYGGGWGDDDDDDDDNYAPPPAKEYAGDHPSSAGATEMAAQSSVGAATTTHGGPSEHHDMNRQRPEDPKSHVHFQQEGPSNMPNLQVHACVRCRMQRNRVCCSFSFLVDAFNGLPFFSVFLIPPTLVDHA